MLCSINILLLLSFKARGSLYFHVGACTLAGKADGFKAANSAAAKSKRNLSRDSGQPAQFAVNSRSLWRSIPLPLGEGRGEGAKLVLEQLVETWQINHRVTLKLLGTLSDEALRVTLSTRGGRDIARQLAHVHEVRVVHAELTSRTNRSAKLPHFAKGESPSKKHLGEALTASARGVEISIREGWANGGKLPGFKRGVIPMIGYLIAHESHHRGSILLTLKQAGHKLSDELKWGLWDWNKL